MKNKELIQELVKLCIDKALDFDLLSGSAFFTIQLRDGSFITVELDEEDANQQLQNAIEQVRGL